MSKYWGNRQWYWYHLISYTSPDTFNIQTKKFYMELIILMTELLPCHKCHKHFTSYIKETPANFNNRETFIDWFIAAHNHVNQLLNKPTITKEEANNLYLEKEILEKENLITVDNLEQDLNNIAEIKIKNLNHSFLNEFIKYHSDRAFYNHSSLFLVAKLVEKLIHIYPCLICRKILLEYNQKNPIKIYGSSISTFRRWYNNFFDKQNFSNHFTKNWKNMTKY
jgi:hypothetical protein